MNETKATRARVTEGFALIWKYMREHSRSIIFLSILGIISAIGAALVPLITGRIIDALIEQATVEIVGREVFLVFVILALWCAVQIVTYFVDWVLSIRSIELAENMSVGFRTKAYDHILHLPLEFHKETRFGSIMENVNMGSFTMRSVTRDALTVAPQLLTLVVAFVFSFFINVWLALILVTSIILYLIVARINMRPLEKLEEEYHGHQRDAFGTVYNVISQTREVKIAAFEKQESEVITNKFTGPLMGVFLNIRRIWQRMSFLQRVLVLATQISIYVVGIFLVFEETISVGELIAFNAYAGLLYGPFIQFNQMWQWLQNYVTNLIEAEKILTLATEPYHIAEEAKAEQPIEGAITFENVSFSYEGGKEVLSDVSFEIPPSSKTALVGRSGEGKSTIIDLIAAFYVPDSGVVQIDGTDTREIDLLNLRSQIGMVSQEIALFNDSIAYNISYGAPEATREDVEQAARYAHAEEFIQEFPEGFDTLVGERGVKLSVGQKQRLAIARAYLQDPQILILDEPTSALDAKTEHDLTETLEKLMAGRTTIIIAHRLSTVRRADNILVLQKGEIVEEGTHSELIEYENGVYRRLYDLQFEESAKNS